MEIDELYINQVGVGQLARITFADGQTHEARDYDGVVSRMDDTGVSSGGVTDYSVEISLTRTEELEGRDERHGGDPGGPERGLHERSL